DRSVPDPQVLAAWSSPDGQVRRILRQSRDRTTWEVEDDRGRMLGRLPALFDFQPIAWRDVVFSSDGERLIIRRWDRSNSREKELRIGEVRTGRWLPGTFEITTRITQVVVNERITGDTLALLDESGGVWLRNSSHPDRFERLSSDGEPLRLSSDSQHLFLKR